MLISVNYVHFHILGDVIISRGHDLGSGGSARGEIGFRVGSGGES